MMLCGTTTIDSTHTQYDEECFVVVYIFFVSSTMIHRVIVVRSPKMYAATII